MWWNRLLQMTGREAVTRESLCQGNRENFFVHCIVQLYRFQCRNLSPPKSLSGFCNPKQSKTCIFQNKRSRHLFAKCNSHFCLAGRSAAPFFQPTVPVTQASASQSPSRYRRHRRCLPTAKAAAVPLARPKPTLATCHQPEASLPTPYRSGTTCIGSHHADAS